MRTITIERSSTTKLFWVLMAVLLVLVVGTGKMNDPGVTSAGLLLLVVAVFPLYLWLLGLSHGLPIWPVFALANGVVNALPMIQSSVALNDYSSGEIIIGGMTMVGFLLLGTVIWLSLTSRTPAAPKSLVMIGQAHALFYLYLFVFVSVAFMINQFTGWIVFAGNLMQVARGITGSLGSMGLFVLSFYHGRGLLNRGQAALLAAGLLATVVFSLTSLILAQAVVPVALVVFGYTLGSNKPPWGVLTTTFVLVVLLHPGKYQMREEFWDGEGDGITLFDLPRFYASWVGDGFAAVGGFSGLAASHREEDSPSSAFERAGNLHMLLLVQKKSPQEVPYCLGATYAPIPRLLVPRFLDDQKGFSHAGNVMLSVNYGVLTIEGAQSTSIGWGLVPEAYANFGYLGVAGLAVVLAVVYAFATRLTVGVPMTSLRFVLGLLAMAAATTADTMGVFLTTQFQAMVGVSLASLVAMRRQLNPYVLEATEEAQLAESTERPGGYKPWKHEPSGNKKRFLASGQRGTFGLYDKPNELSPLFPLFAPAEAGASGPELAAPAGVEGAGDNLDLPKWAPRRQHAAARKRAETLRTAESARQAESTPQPRQRQLAVPFQKYRRKRGL
ncbi:MAG: hypothetical protein ACOYOL_05785 [Chthoniobacterales bacterium]